MPAVLVTGPTVTQDFAVLPQRRPLPQPVLILPTHRGMAQTELTWVPGYVPRQFTCPKMVTHPGTNWVQCRVTTLIEANTLPLSQTGTLAKDHSHISNKTYKGVQRISKD